MKIASVEFIFILWTTVEICGGFPLFNFNLCGYLVQGGTCQDTCKYEARHSFGISLCAHNLSHSNKCCIPLDHPLVKAKQAAEAAAAAAAAATTKTSSPTTTTEPLDKVIVTTISTTEAVTSSSATTTVTEKSTGQNCGFSKRHSRFRRLVGGTDAPRGAWAWQVALRLYTGRYICGGVVISDKWMLTAAHCLQSYEKEYVRVFVGDQTLSYDKSGRQNTKAIQQIIMHHDFQDNVELNVTDLETDTISTVTQHVHDLALIELQEPLIFSEDIQPVCFLGGAEERTNPSKDDVIPDDIDYNDCWVTGWGEESDREDIHVQRLKEVRGHVIDYKQCGKQWGTNFTDEIVCFKSEGGTGPCKGDSGSGVSCRRTDGRYSLVGVISWGRDDCIHDQHPSVLTKVQSYRKWIDDSLNLI